MVVPPFEPTHDHADLVETVGNVGVVGLGVPVAQNVSVPYVVDPAGYTTLALPQAPLTGIAHDCVSTGDPPVQPDGDEVKTVLD